MSEEIDDRLNRLYGAIGAKRRHMYYTLIGHEPAPCDLMTWAKMFEDSGERMVAKTEIGLCHVSTVFLGVDHSFGEGAPLLFKTMIFGGRFETDEYQTRCTTWAQAEEMHKVACETAAAEPSA